MPQLKFITDLFNKEWKAEFEGLKIVEINNLGGGLIN